MVLTTEFRVVMPFNLDQYNRGARYTTAKWSKQATMEGGGRDGVELVEEKVYHDKEWNVSGTYTHKIYHIGGWIPSWVKSLLPASALKVEEKAYNAFPYCKTTMSSPFLGSRFSLTVESIHLPYESGKEENALKIAGDKLKTRHVEHIDIVNSEFKEHKQYRSEEDPSKVNHPNNLPTKTHGPLSSDWQSKLKDYMCIYKLVTINIHIFGLSSKLEHWLTSFQRDIILRFNRQVYCYQNEWSSLPMETITGMEQKTFDHVNSVIAKKQEQAAAAQ